MMINDNLSSSCIAQIAGFLAFSGISVLCQVYSIASSSGLSIKYYVISKVIQGISSYLVIRIILKLFPVSINVFKSSYPILNMNYVYSAIIFILILTLLAILFILLIDKRINK